MGLVANGTNALRVILRTIVVIDEKHLIAVLFRHWHSRQRPTTISSTNKSGEESVLEVDIEPPVEAPGILDEARADTGLPAAPSNGMMASYAVCLSDETLNAKRHLEHNRRQKRT